MSIFKVLILILLALPNTVYGAGLKSVRLKIFTPSTRHDLFYKDDNNPGTEFLLEPQNNERVGLYFIYKGVELGFSVDPVKNDTETETLDFEFVKNLKDKHRFSLRYQKLDGLSVKATSISTNLKEVQFLDSLSSTRVDLSGIHEIYTNDSESHFKSFYMNRLKKEHNKKYSYSLFTNWIARYAKIERPEGLVFQPTFFNAPIMNRDYIKAVSAYSSLGILNSLRIHGAISTHLEAVLGGGYFKTLNNTGGQFKNSGFDYIANSSIGFSWNGQNQIINLRFGYQKTQHIESVFSYMNWVYFL